MLTVVSFSVQESAWFRVKDGRVKDNTQRGGGAELGGTEAASDSDGHVAAGAWPYLWPSAPVFQVVSTMRYV